MNGSIVLFEGIDGSGKTTQAVKLQEALKEAGRDSMLLHFPRYAETFFGREVKAYLNGEFGGLEHTHPKLIAMLYAGDRFEKRGDLLRWLEEGKVIILDRYVPSNIAHMGAKLPESDFDAFQAWVENLEYGVYGLPRPDITFFFDMPLDITYELVLQKEARDYTDKKQDLHEENKTYQRSVYNYYRRMSEQGWLKIACTADGRPRDIADIHADIRERVFAHLGVPV